LITCGLISEFFSERDKQNRSKVCSYEKKGERTSRNPPYAGKPPFIQMRGEKGGGGKLLPSVRKGERQKGAKKIHQVVQGQCCFGSIDHKKPCLRLEKKGHNLTNAERGGDSQKLCFVKQTQSSGKKCSGKNQEQKKKDKLTKRRC